MRIGDAAARLGVETHVLRHWEDVGVLAPRRSPSGHREYDQSDIDRARLIRIAQGVGLSLAQMHEVAAIDRGARRAAVDRHRRQLQHRIELLRAADEFLAHTVECGHPVLSECPECSAFVARCEANPMLPRPTKSLLG